jgi:hypothetical protein
VQKYAEKVQELWEKYIETYDDDDERKYLKVKTLYDTAVAKFAEFEVENGSTNKLQKAGIDVLEKVAIKGLAEQHCKGNEGVAQCIWEEYVDLIGKNKAVEWLTAMAECLFNEEPSENGGNDFLSQMRSSKSKHGNRKKK